ncbi:hypothetical protein LguiA_021745 [Lonicera macranthoides]
MDLLECTKSPPLQTFLKSSYHSKPHYHFQPKPPTSLLENNPKPNQSKYLFHHLHHSNTQSFFDMQRSPKAIRQSYKHQLLL